MALRSSLVSLKLLSPRRPLETWLTMAPSASCAAAPDARSPRSPRPLSEALGCLPSLDSQHVLLSLLKHDGVRETKHLDK